ncbi:HNH endonuclease signature motif containing protein [Rhodococcus sp. OK302]|uniref:HNH endonuclease signature motif containing protein n=1 Tax=Rhodococcus sp. OK302 TaxID=1882769 RepID=UPI000B9459D7|nr:HNH endonuclease signature motif containing protein [Rhodococcus sp. OK302]OYD68492.1 HNH endonuclease [Rhodococcus sp. OK302]
MSVDTVVADVVTGSAVNVRGMLWRLRPCDVRDVAVTASAEILRLEAIRVAAVDELALHPDESVLCYRGVGRWLAANTMLQNAAGNKIAALGVALRAFPDIAAQFDAGDLTVDHAALITAFCESPPKGMPDRALPHCIKTLLAAASGVEATTTKLRYAIAVLERIFESEDIPPGEDDDRNELRIAPTLNGRVVIKGDFDALTGEMLLSALSGLSMPTPAADGTPDARSAAKRTADALTELIRRYLDNAATGVDGGQRPHVNVHVSAKDLAEHRDCASTREPASDIKDRAAQDNDVEDAPVWGFDNLDDFDDLDVGHMPWMGPLSITRTRMLACDCMLSTVLLDEHGAPLDVSPLKRLVSAAQRTALIARDKGCAFPSCDAVPAWCDAHHIEPWSKGGLTVMGNLTLLCRSHHTLIHRKAGFAGQWEIKMGSDRRPWFIPPAGIDPDRRPRRSTLRPGPVLRT